MPLGKRARKKRQPVRARQAGAAVSPLPPETLLEGSTSSPVGLAVAVGDVPDATTPARSLSGATRCGWVRRRATRERVKTFPPLSLGSDHHRTRAHATTRPRPPRLLRGAASASAPSNASIARSRAGVPCSGTARRGARNSARARGAIRYAGGGREVGASQAARGARGVSIWSRVPIAERPLRASQDALVELVKRFTGRGRRDRRHGTDIGSSLYLFAHKRLEKGSGLGKRIVLCALKVY
jgi:hypothetical protein